MCDKLFESGLKYFLSIVNEYPTPKTLSADRHIIKTRRQFESRLRAAHSRSFYVRWGWGGGGYGVKNYFSQNVMGSSKLQSNFFGSFSPMAAGGGGVPGCLAVFLLHLTYIIRCSL